MFTLSRIQMLCQEILPFSNSNLNIFKFKNCLFGVSDIVKNSDKENNVYSEQGIIFDSAGFWSFDNDFAISVIIFGVDNHLIPTIAK